MPSKSALGFLALSVSLVVGSESVAQDLASLKDAVRSFAKTPTAPAYEYALTDLDGDRHPDAVVLIHDRLFCGSGGCAMVIFRSTTRGFKLVSSSTITNEPILVLPVARFGWRTLVVTAKGEGAVIMRFNGSRYPLNPTMQGKANGVQLSRAKALKFRN